MTYLSNTKLYENKVDEAHRQLGYAILHNAVKDYVNLTVAYDKEESEEKKNKILKKKNDILKDLRGEWMNSLTDGTAKVSAERLLVDFEGIKERILKAEADEKRKEEFVC